MNFSIQVTPKGEPPYTVHTSLAGIIAWERKFKRKASDLANGFGLEDLAFMAYEACKESNVPVPVVFDDFVKRLANVEIVDDEGETNPLPGAPGHDS